MITIFAGLIAGLICGYIILHYQSKHHKLTGDHDLTGVQKFHARSVPRIGGVVIYFGISVGIIIRYFSPDKTAFLVGIQLLLASVPAFSGGLIEDLTKKVGVITRLLMTALSAATAGFIFNAWLTDIQVIGLDVLLAIPAFSIIFTCFAVAGIANAFNIIDGFNGLASGVALLILVAISYVAFQVKDYGVMLCSFAAFGAIVGFIFWNFPKGLIFLGDGGAYLVGFWIAELCILLVTRNPSVSKWFPVLICIYPIFETIFTIYRRLLKKMHPGMPDANHLHQMIFRRIVSNPSNINLDELAKENSKTSPYLWVLSGLTIIIAILFWQVKAVLQFSILAFCFFYIWLYWSIVRFNVPLWLKKR